ncbi:MAG: class I SAM-dependent methyltransferase [Betaproteobacteria bacterium]|nr:class I SAM-dependent methyltransferase [Betaproteobacteria bacterium]
MRILLALSLAFSAAVALAQAQPADPGYQPSVGQEGKDVVWVPTPQALVDRMLDLAKVTSKDFVMDLGSGDGRTVITAAKRGAQAVGIEYNPSMVELSQKNAEKAGVSERAKFMKADLFETDLSKATVITMFLLPEINLKLRPRILDLKPGTRVVSNTFTMGEWEPDQTSKLGPGDGCDAYWCTALLWIVPAKVAGTYKTSAGELVLKQDFQKVHGTLTTDGKAVPIDSGRVRGEEVSFRAGGKSYRGRFSNGALELK